VENFVDDISCLAWKMVVIQFEQVKTKFLFNFPFPGRFLAFAKVSLFVVSNNLWSKSNFWCCYFVGGQSGV